MAKSSRSDPQFEIEFFEAVHRRCPDYTEVVGLLGGLTVIGLAGMKLIEGAFSPAGRGLLDEMPEWVKAQIDMAFQRPDPAHLRTDDGDRFTFNHRLGGDFNRLTDFGKARAARPQFGAFAKGFGA